MLNFRGATYGAWRVFWDTLFPSQVTGPGAGARTDWGSTWVRRTRYEMFDAFSQSTQYFGRIGESLREEMNLYRHIRPITNTCGRIIQSGVDHIQGGGLDPAAGDGSDKPTCLPFVLGATAPLNLRAAIADVLKESSWQSRKGVYVRTGLTCGDVALEPVPDPAKGKVRVRVVNPGELDWITRDPYGNVTGFAAERWEADPEDRTGRALVLYREEVTHENGVLVYRTFRDDAPYAWPGTEGQEFESRWTFCPLVVVQNIDKGLPWGMSELGEAIFKTLEGDDQKSNLGDGARKLVNTPWFLTGAQLPPTPPPILSQPWQGDPFNLPEGTVVSGGPPRPFSRPNIAVEIEEKDGIAILTCTAGDARMTPLTVTIPVKDIDDAIRSLAESLVDAYPELQADRIAATGQVASGVAIERARQKAEDKYNDRRGQYDDGLRRALEMACAMGADLGFPGFEGLGVEVDHGGKLDFVIGARPVFHPTEAEIIEKETARAAVVKTLTESGVPLGSAMKRAGYSGKTILETLAERDQEDVDASARTAARQANLFGEQDPIPAPATGTAVESQSNVNPDGVTEEGLPDPGKGAGGAAPPTTGAGKVTANGKA